MLPEYLACKHYQVRDYILDPRFQDWIIKPNPELDQFWTGLIIAIPSQAPILAEARQILADLQFKTETPEPGAVNHALERFRERINAEKQTRVRSITRWIAAAASLILVISISYYFMAVHGFAKVQYSTVYGEKKNFKLPDGSIVILNGNSSLRYLRRYEGKRSVEIKGEAWFDVQHLADSNAYFEVTGADYAIRVLGTAFTVRDREELAEIVLERGSIQFTTGGTKELMKPGQRVRYAKASHHFSKDSIDASAYSGWKDNRLQLPEPRLKNIIRYLEETYGKTILLTDSTLSNRMIEGPILLENFDDALFVITTTLDLRVTNKGSTYTLQRR